MINVVISQTVSYLKKDLKRESRSLLVVDASCVFHDDRHLRFVEHRLRNHSQHSTRPHESQFELGIRTLDRREETTDYKSCK